MKHPPTLPLCRRSPGLVSRAAPRERGIALFIVLVVVFVVSVVTAQLVYTTKVEERIAKSRTGELEMVLAQESAARRKKGYSYGYTLLAWFLLPNYFGKIVVRVEKAPLTPQPPPADCRYRPFSLLDHF